FQAGVAYAEVPGPAQAVVSDLDGDGKPDVVVSDNLFGRVYVFPNKGDGMLGALRSLEVSPNPGPLASGDFNGDGLPDLATASSYSPYGVGVLISASNGTLRPPVNYAVNAKPHGLVAADVNGDSILDLIVAIPGTGSVGVLLGNGDGTFEAPVYYPAGME